MNAFEMAGLRCIVNTEFGQNPSVSLKNAASSLVSGSWSDVKGVTNGMVCSVLFSEFLEIILSVVKNFPVKM